MRLGIVWAFGPDSVGKGFHCVRATQRAPVPRTETSWSNRPDRLSSKDGVSALDLEDDPRFFFPCSFHCLHFYLSRTTLEELADEHHAKRIDTLSWPHAAVDETVSHLSLALLAAFENPVTVGKLFVDHVAVALSTHFAYA